MDLYKYMQEKVKIEDIKEFEEDTYELAIVRKVLKEAARIFYRNYTFFLNKEQLNKRDEIYNKEIDLNNIEDFAIVCKSYCTIVKDILKSGYDIDVELISPDSDQFRHIDLLVTTKKGNKYIVDPLADLVEMQVGMKTNNFASKQKYDNFYTGKIEDISFLSEEELKEIDDRIHYTTQGLYMDDLIEMIRKELLDIEKLLLEDEEFAQIVMGRKYEGEPLTDEQKVEVKLNFICIFFGNRRYINGIVDLIMYAKTLLNKIFSEQEIKLIKSYSFFVDDKDLKDDRLRGILLTEEERKRGIVFEANNKCYILTLDTEEYLKLEKDEWEEMVKGNNIFIKPMYPVRLLNYLKKLGADRNIIHHNEFLRLFSQFEQKMLDDGYDLEQIKEYVEVTATTIRTKYNGIMEYGIENNNLVVYNANTKSKEKVIYEDEGREIEYVDVDVDDGR